MKVYKEGNCCTIMNIFMVMIIKDDKSIIGNRGKGRRKGRRVQLLLSSNDTE
jgi:hypothetical protein